MAEITPRSVGWGLFLCVVFTVASAYSGLKVGQVLEAAIPISILAIGLARLYPRRSTLLENVIITGIGGLAGSVVAGAIFTLPALYILKLDPHPVQTILICLAGGCLGVLFLIPLRRYFVRDMHGLLPYPEATAITEVLVTGEKGGSQAKLLLEATAIAGVYDFLVTTFHVWKEYLDFLFIPTVRTLAERAKMVFNFDAIGFILGLGYVMGLRSSLILCAGGVLSNLVLVPLIWMIGSHISERRGISGADTHCADDRHADFPRVCALRGSGGHRHGGDLRDSEIDAHCGRIVWHRHAGFPARRNAGGTDRPGHFRDGHPAGSDRQRHRRGGFSGAISRVRPR